MLDLYWLELQEWGSKLLFVYGSWLCSWEVLATVSHYNLIYNASDIVVPVLLRAFFELLLAQDVTCMHEKMAYLLGQVIWIYSFKRALMIFSTIQLDIATSKAEH